MEKLKNLNDAQRQAVLATQGPTMILAGAGSGKTRTLVARIVHLLNEKNVSPFRILAVTFSNKAAREMRERVGQESGQSLGALQITTFHSFCAQVLRTESGHIGLSRNFTIYDQSESKAVAKAILNRHGISQKEVSPFMILNFISELKNNGHYHQRDDAYSRTVDLDDPFYQYYLEYEEELHRNNAVDFGGLISGVLQLFETHPDLLNLYQDRFQYVLVDEYQDTNRAQFQLVTMLAQKSQNICVVGDEDQSIYSWRGADIKNILDFEKHFPDTRILKLEQNYRSSKTIIEAASHVIARNLQRKGKELWTDNEQGESIEIVECTDDKIEASFAVKKIKEIISANDCQYSDIAIFYRNNAQSRLIEDALRNESIPYRVVGGIKFYDRKEIKDMLAYLRLVVNTQDNLALSRVINTPGRGIGAVTLRKLEQKAIEQDCSLFDLISGGHELDHFSTLKLSSKVKSSLGQFSELITQAKQSLQAQEQPSKVYETILHHSGYWDYIKSSKDYESLARLENLEELYSAICQYEEAQKNPTLTGFLEGITLDANKENEDLLKGEICLMTIHSSKGLEFPYAILVGVEENIFPSMQSLEEGPERIEEERRLFYVAMTRAMKHLVITFAMGRMLYGSVKFNGPSRFLYEIPEKYYEWTKKGQTQSSRVQSPHREYDDFDFSDEYSQEIIYNQAPFNQKNVSSSWHKSSFSEGSKVNHALYGEGKIIESSGCGQDEKVLIRFKDGECKRFMVKFAPLTLV